MRHICCSSRRLRAVADNIRAMLMRAARPGDAEGCLKAMLKAMAASDDYGRPNPEEIADHWRGRVCGYLTGEYDPGFALEERAAFMAEIGGEIVGFFAGQRTLRYACDGELQWAFVSPSWQRKGIGSSLFALQRKWFVDRGMRKICVNAPPDMSTRGFYLKHGAEPFNPNWLVWEDIGRAAG